MPRCTTVATCLKLLYMKIPGLGSILLLHVGMLPLSGRLCTVRRNAEHAPWKFWKIKCLMRWPFSIEYNTLVRSITGSFWPSTHTLWMPSFFPEQAQARIAREFRPEGVACDMWLLGTATWPSAAATEAVMEAAALPMATCGSIFVFRTKRWNVARPSEEETRPGALYLSVFGAHVFATGCLSVWVQHLCMPHATKRAGC